MINKVLDTVIVGGGMITEMQILPSIYQLQRMGFINEITICELKFVISNNQQIID